MTSETILGNVRVLAIDQAVEEKNGQKVVVGKTATLELSPRQSETLELAHRSARFRWRCAASPIQRKINRRSKTSRASAVPA